MKTSKFVLGALLIPLLCFGIRERVHAQNLDLSKSVTNITTSSNGTSASQNDVLEYTINIRNMGTVSFTDARLFDNIPAGSVYLPNTTYLNGAILADAGGRMPFAESAGAVIRSPGQGAGILAPGSLTVIKFRVRVTANGGNITNYGTLEGTHQGNHVVQSTNTVFTNLNPDPTCSVIYQSTASIQSGVPGGGYQYRYIKVLNTADGTSGAVIYDGSNGRCYNALTGAALANGSVLTYSSAIAYEKRTNRIYFVNNSSSSRQDLCYIDLNASPVCARRYVNYPLETTTGTGWNINRMAICSDGFGYAVTESGSDIIRFTINVTGPPTITRMGALINDVINDTNNILVEKGGDIFSDGSGNLYLIANSSKLYKIKPATRVATFLGSVNPFPGTSNSMAFDAGGNVYIGGAYQNVYTVNLATMAGNSITGGNTNNVWTNGDYTSCAFPVLAPALIANKTYRNLNGRPYVLGGDTVEYVIEVTNTGNINAAGVKLYDAIPPSTNYIPNSTKLNGVPIPDAGGVMPFAVTGGKFVYSLGEQNGIIRPGGPFRAVMTFQAKVPPNQTVCNQSRITLFDMNGNTIFVNTNDPSQPGGQNPTCFFSNGVLPVNTLLFKGLINNDKSVLQWSIKEEGENVDHFEIEYSADGEEFATIDKLGSKGSTMGTNYYQYIDQSSEGGINRFYRLKVIGKRGDHLYSPIVKLTFKNLHVIKVQPNPFEQEIKVQLRLRSAAQVELRLTDLRGLEVLRNRVSLSMGEQVLPVKAPVGLSAGVYILEILTGSDNNIHREKLLKR